MHNYDKSWKGACRTVHSYIDVHVERALKELRTNPGKADNQSQTRYILLHEMAKQIRDPIPLRFQVLNVFISARDTTAVMLGNTFFHLARNPDIWTQLRAKSVALGDRPLTFDVLKSLHLFRYVIFETLRLQGPSGRIYRTAIRDTILPTGVGIDGTSPIFVKKGTVVALNLWGIHHDKDFWGEDVDKFNPQRWFDTKTQSQWHFVPFLGGPRICPAQQQVLTQAVYLLVRLTREFKRIENKDPVEEYVGLVKALTESKNGVKVAFSA
jgi:cytochrome P450